MENVENINEKNNGPLMCVNNCGFFGNANMMNMCSKCYRETTSKKRKEMEELSPEKGAKQQKVDKEVVSESIEKAIEKKEEVISEIKSSLTDQVTETKTNTVPTAVATPPKEVSRCHSCPRKIGLTAIKCRCGFKFCGKHRYSDQHNCTFDYKENAKRELIEKNPKVIAAKIETL